MQFTFKLPRADYYVKRSIVRFYLLTWVASRTFPFIRQRKSLAGTCLPTHCCLLFCVCIRCKRQLQSCFRVVWNSKAFVDVYLAHRVLDVAPLLLPLQCHTQHNRYAIPPPFIYSFYKTFPCLMTSLAVLQLRPNYINFLVSRVFTDFTRNSLLISSFLLPSALSAPSVPTTYLYCFSRFGPFSFVRVSRYY